MGTIFRTFLKVPPEALDGSCALRARHSSRTTLISKLRAVKKTTSSGKAGQARHVLVLRNLLYLSVSGFTGNFLIVSVLLLAL